MDNNCGAFPNNTDQILKLQEELATKGDQVSIVWGRAIYNVLISPYEDNEEAKELYGSLASGRTSPEEWEIEVSRLLLGPEICRNFTQNSPLSSGFLVGFLISMIPRPEDVIEEANDLAASIDPEALVNSYLQELGITQILASGDKDDIKQALRGIQKGLTSFYTEDDNVRSISPASIVYMTLLLNAEKMEKFATVRDFYDIMKRELRNDLPHDFESFKKICHRVGFRGTKYKSRSS